MTDFVEGPALAALSCGKPAYLVVLLHGEGGDGQSMIDHALNWAPTMPKAEFLAAEIPFVGDDVGVEPIAPALDRFLDAALASRRLPDSHLALVGFSKGATLALQVGLGRRDQIAAIVAFSGGVDDVERLARDIRSRPPTLLIHGEADPIVPFVAMLEAKAALAARGVPVKSLRRAGLGHEMDDEGVIAAGDFLTEHVVHKTTVAHDHHDDH